MCCCFATAVQESDATGLIYHKQPSPRPSQCIFSLTLLHPLLGHRENVNFYFEALVSCTPEAYRQGAGDGSLSH
jgi:hypothetical protein